MTLEKLAAMLADREIDVSISFAVDLLDIINIDEWCDCFSPKSQGTQDGEGNHPRGTHETPDKPEVG